MGFFFWLIAPSAGAFAIREMAIQPNVISDSDESSGVQPCSIFCANMQMSRSTGGTHNQCRCSFPHLIANRLARSRRFSVCQVESCFEMWSGIIFFCCLNRDDNVNISSFIRVIQLHAKKRSEPCMNAGDSQVSTSVSERNWCGHGYRSGQPENSKTKICGVTSWQYCSTPSLVPAQLLVPEGSGSQRPVWTFTCMLSFPQNMATWGSATANTALAGSACRTEKRKQILHCEWSF